MSIGATGNTRTTERAARLRGIRFLAAHALAAGDAYSFRVGPDGLVSFQGDPGTLQRLVELLGAESLPSEPGEEATREWGAAVAFEGGTVRVELTEVGP